MTGTLLNVAAVLVGATLGSLLGDRLPDRVRGIALQAVGLTTLLIGVQMALNVQNMLVLLASLVIGGVLGEVLRIEQRLEGLGAWIEMRTQTQTRGGVTGGASGFVRGFVTSSLVFCVGPMTILGSIQDGLTGDFRLLAVKSLLDGFTSIAFASTLGAGVFFAAPVVLVYQGGIALLAMAIGRGLPDPASQPAVLEMTAVGGVLILGIGLKLLAIKEVRVGNLLPAVGLAPLFTVLFGGPLARLLGGV